MDKIFHAIDWLVAHQDVITSYIGKASLLATFTKTQWDNRVLNWLAAGVHLVAVDPQRAKAALNNTTLGNNFNE